MKYCVRKQAALDAAHGRCDTANQQQHASQWHANAHALAIASSHGACNAISTGSEPTHRTRGSGSANVVTPVSLIHSLCSDQELEEKEHVEGLAGLILS